MKIIPFPDPPVRRRKRKEPEGPGKVICLDLHWPINGPHWRESFQHIVCVRCGKEFVVNAITGEWIPFLKK